MINFSKNLDPALKKISKSRPENPLCEILPIGISNTVLPRKIKKSSKLSFKKA